MDVYRTSDERFENLPDYPWAPKYTEVNGLRLNRIDEGEGPLVLCFHGEPSWSFLYRKMAKRLIADGHRVVCPDLVGFGRSDKPKDMDFYTYASHSESLAAHLAALDGIEDATVVVQDWGGLLGLKWAADHMDQVGRVFIMNTSLATAGGSEAFAAWRNFVEKTPDLPIGFILQGATKTDLSDEVVAAYESPWPTAESKAGPAKFPLLVPFEASDPGAAEMAAAMEVLSAMDKPCTVAFSDSDPMFPFPQAAEWFTKRIPTAEEPVMIENASHFLQEDNPDGVVDAMYAGFGNPIGSA
ncbi:MAG: haloalkane dehalogenase [Actinomycetes bacterium]